MLFPTNHRHGKAKTGAIFQIVGLTYDSSEKSVFAIHKLRIESIQGTQFTLTLKSVAAKSRSGWIKFYIKADGIDYPVTFLKDNKVIRMMSTAIDVTKLINTLPEFEE